MIRSLHLAALTFEGFAGEDQENDFEDIDDDVAEDSEVVHGSQFLPDRVVRVEGSPDREFSKSEDEIDDEEKHDGSDDLYSEWGTILSPRSSLRFCQMK